MRRVFVKALGFGALPLLLGGCQSLPAGGLESQAPMVFACEQPRALCHQGRFGVVWRQQLADGGIESEAVSGTYAWQSGWQKGPGQTEPLPYVRLVLRSTLGPTLGELQRLGQVYQAITANGQTVFADSWQALFAQVFVADLPAEALVAWLHNPQASAPPQLPSPWVWQAHGGRYRLVQQTDTLFARVDFIPQW